MATTEGARLSAAEHDWVAAHAALTRLAHERAAADAEEGLWLLRAHRAEVHVHLGYGSFSEYVERIFGYKPRTTQEKLRVAEALEKLPELARALDAGEVGWCAVRELTRVAVPETEGAWLAAARGQTIRQLEELVSGRTLGDTPDAPATHPPRSRVLRFEVAPETFALFRDAMRELRRAAGGGLEDDAVLLAMARHILAGPGDDGRAPYQVSLTVCAACSRGDQLGAGELVPVGTEAVAMAECDGQHMGHLLPRAANENGQSTTAADLTANDAHMGAPDPGHIPSEPIAAEAGAPPAPAPVGAPSSHADAAQRNQPRIVGDGEPTGRREALEVHGRRKPDARARDQDTAVDRFPRAKQTIPPAVRRAVLARDRGRCRVPGCTHATFLDLHHIRPRSEGGRNDPKNLITLCSAHHRAAHRGELLIQPDRDGSPAFQHADGSVYGHALAPRVVDAQTKVFAGLRHLGFRERDVKAVLAELRADDELRNATPEHLLREALCRIRPTR